MEHDDSSILRSPKARVFVTTSVEVGVKVLRIELENVAMVAIDIEYLDVYVTSSLRPSTFQLPFSTFEKIVLDIKAPINEENLSQEQELVSWIVENDNSLVVTTRTTTPPLC